MTSPTPLAKDGRGALCQRLDDLSSDLQKAEAECEATYIAWDAAVAARKRIARERNEVWDKLLDSIVSPTQRGET